MSNIYPDNKYVIYKTTNLLNGMYYIGRRILRCKGDSYLGSGIRFENAVDKYGKENFKREILYSFDKYDDMISKEMELVNMEIAEDDMSYNISLGGKGARLFGERNPMYNKNHTEESNEKNRKSTLLRFKKYGHPREDTIHSTESRLKMSHAKKGLYNGENNPSAILTKEQVKQIRQDPRLYQYGGVTIIAKEYNVSRGTISAIKFNRTWNNN